MDQLSSIRRETEAKFNFDDEWEQGAEESKKSKSKKKGPKAITNVSPGRPKQEKQSIKADEAKIIASLIKRDMHLPFLSNSQKKSWLEKKCILYAVEVTPGFPKAEIIKKILNLSYGLVVAVCQNSKELLTVFEWVASNRKTFNLFQQYNCVVKGHCYTR